MWGEAMTEREREPGGRIRSRTELTDYMQVPPGPYRAASQHERDCELRRKRETKKVGESLAGGAHGSKHPITVSAFLTAVR